MCVDVRAFENGRVLVDECACECVSVSVCVCVINNDKRKFSLLYDVVFLKLCCLLPGHWMFIWEPIDNRN